MDCKEIREMYKLMFAEYPDIVTVKDLQAMLGISRHAAYDLLGEGEISCIRLGNAYKTAITKNTLAMYLWMRWET